MSKLNAAEVSQLLLLVSLVGKRAWTNKARRQQNIEKNLVIYDPNPCQCFSLLLFNRDKLLHLPTSTSFYLFYLKV